MVDVLSLIAAMLWLMLLLNVLMFAGTHRPFLSLAALAGAAGLAYIRPQLLDVFLHFHSFVSGA